MKTKYPVYIVSKGRYENPVTAKAFLRDGVDFFIAVEPQEVEQYARAVGRERVLELPFSNLGLGSYPARNWIWEHSAQNGHRKHWIFDDNIYRAQRHVKGTKIPISFLTAIRVLERLDSRFYNVAITAFNYDFFAPRNTPKAFYFNVHAYSAMLIKNDMPYRWRLKYNEDVDLCLQVLHNGLCTILVNAISAKKISTTMKMKGGNQDELYKNNAHDKKVLKARSLEEVWPQYVETKTRFNRPHHFVDWKKHFKHPLLLKPGVTLETLKEEEELILKPVVLTEIKSQRLKDLLGLSDAE